MPPPTVVTDTNITTTWGNAVVAELGTHTSQIAATNASLGTTNANLASKANLTAVNWFEFDNFWSYGPHGDLNPGHSRPGIWIGGNTVWCTSDYWPNDRPIFVANVTGAAIYNGKQFMAYRRDHTDCGSVSLGDSYYVNYFNTSDPRLKTPPPAQAARFAEGDPQPTGIGDAAARVQQLGAHAWTGHWVNPDSGEPVGDHPWDFLSSHDVEDVAPYAVTGQRDAVAGPPQDEGDPPAGTPVYQQVNYPALVPLLTAALSQALDRIADLTTRLEALETA